MKRKIGIITLIGYDNYGQKLQNYALQQIIKSFGYGVDTIYVNQIPVSVLQRFYRAIRNGTLINKLKPGSITKRFSRKENTNIASSVLQAREQAIRRFVDNDINQITVGFKSLYAPDFSKAYNYFISGSDQVWNPYWFNDYFFLNFAPQEKRIAYSASFGTSTIPRGLHKHFSKLLKGFSAVSVREDAGKDIVNNLVGMDVPVLVDPTLLLTKDEWAGFADKADKATGVAGSEDFLAAFFLGDMPDSYIRKCSSIANACGLEIINFNDSQFCNMGPVEFVDAIRKASFVCTDSFHCLVFSILFHVPFLAFNRTGNVPAMGSRITTLLGKCGFGDYGIQDEQQDISIRGLDFSTSDELLSQERELAMAYLKNALRIEE